MKGKNKAKTIEIIVYWVILLLFFVSNLWYFRGFHKIVFAGMSILCVIKTLRYIFVVKWKKRHIFNSVVSGLLLCGMLKFTCEMDIYIFPSTQLRHYEESINQYDSTEKNRYGIFPEIIPDEAKNVEYYYTTEGYWKPRDNMHAYLKMTVSKEYLDSLMEKYNKEKYYIKEQDCSVLTKENASDYLATNHLNEYVEEFYGEKNCTLYFLFNEGMGFVINWDKKIVKLFLDNRF